MQHIIEVLAEIGRARGVECRVDIDRTHAQPGADLTDDVIALGNVLETLALSM